MKTGDKVVCVSDIPTIFPERFKQLPIKGRVYVIRAFDYSPVTGGLGLYLVGIIGAIHPKWRQECGFYAHHFRKLDEMKEDEIMEGFTWRNARIFNPHSSFRALADASKKEVYRDPQ